MAGDVPNRLDQWLWFARIVKSRTLAQKFIRSGKIRINKAKVTNPAKPVQVSDILTISLERRILLLKILAMGKRRGPYREACLLYEDIAPEERSPTAISSIEYEEKVPRPAKHQRRKLMALKNKQYFR